jgi:signal transduction histidine kinase
VRERLVAAFVGLTVVVVALYGIPRAYFLADLVRSDEQARVDRTADALAVALDLRDASGEPVRAAYLDSLTSAGEWLAVVLPSGERVASTGGVADDDDVAATRDLSGGGSVTVARSADAVGSEVSRAILPLVLLGLGLVLVAAIGGFVLAGRLARPFQELAVAARSLGEGRFRPEVPDSRVPEARDIALALTSAGEELDELLTRERELVSQASHELRTPVTALRLDLEDLALWPDTPPSVRAGLERSVAELDRLATAIAAVLDQSRGRRQETAIDLDLDALVADAVARLPRTGGLEVVHHASGPAPTRLDPVPVVRALQLMVEGCRAVGASRVDLEVVTRPGHYEVHVTGAGAGSSADTNPHWAATSQAAAVAGGQLSATDEAIVLRLPLVRPTGRDPDHLREL